MGEIRRQSLYSTVFVYAGVIIGFITTGILMPRLLSESENGVVKLLISYSLLFAQLGSLGFTVSTVKIFPKFREQQSKHKGFFLLLSIVGITGFIVFLVSYFAIKPLILEREIEKSSLFASYFSLIIPLTFFSIFFNLLDGYARVLYQSVIGSFLKEFLQRIFILIALLYFVFIEASFGDFLLFYTIALSLPTVILFFYLLIKGEVSLDSHKLLKDKKILTALLSVSSIGLITGFSSIAIAQIDAIMINFFYDNKATGIYSITFYYGTLVVMPARALFRIASTYLSDAFDKNDIDTIKSIQKKSCINQSIIGLLIFLGLWINIDNVFHILPEEYLPGKYVIFFIGISNLVQMASGLSSQIVLNSKYYKYSAVFVIIYLIIIIGTNIFLIPAYGIVGAAIASAVSILCFKLIKFIFLLKKYRIQPYNYKYFILVLTGLASYGISVLIPVQESFIFDILLRSTVITLLYGSTVYYLNLSDDINKLVRQIISRMVR